MLGGRGAPSPNLICINGVTSLLLFILTLLAFSFILLLKMVDFEKKMHTVYQTWGNRNV